jgi:hypothetical protein
MEYYDKWKNVFKEVEKPENFDKREDIVPPPGLDLNKEVRFCA